MKIDKKLIKELTDYLNELGLTELEYGNNELKIKVSKSSSTSNNTIENKTIPTKKTSAEKVIDGYVEVGFLNIFHYSERISSPLP